MHKFLPNKYYFNAIVAVILSVGIMIAIFIFISLRQYQKQNLRNAETEAKNISTIINETFDYSNRINRYIGKQIAKSRDKNLKFIASLFKETSSFNNPQPLSWTSFDWVEPNNLQTVNSRLGIRKDPPDMSAREYTRTSKINPWKLQVSFPVFGNPSGTWVIPAGTGVTDNKNNFLGIVVVGFNITELTNKVAQSINDDVSFVVLDKYNNIVIQSADNNKSPDDNFYKIIKANSFFAKDNDYLKEPISVNGIKYSYYQKMADYPYVILTGFHQDLLATKFNSLILPHILEFILFTIFFLVILYLLKTRITALLITEQKLSHSLDLANQSKIRLIKATSHDLRNYIFGITGLSKILLEKNTIKDDNLQLIKVIVEQSEEMENFVEDLLDTNHNETGKFTLEKVSKYNINDLTKRIVLLNQNLSLKSQIDIKVNIDETIPELTCDARRMKQIFNNLITNAIKYSTANTIVNITTKYIKELEQIYIEFKDQGIGMSEEEIDMALNGQGRNIDKSSLDKPIDSHGIGMPIVKHLVELHNGKMEIQSKKGRGTTIKLCFPINNSILESKPNEPKIFEKRLTKDVKISYDSKKILLVEDNPVNIKITSRILENASFQVKSATNGKEAIELLDEENFDLIFMDGEMPIMNGYETAKKIRDGKIFKKFTKYKTIPIIALMGNSDAETIRKAQDCGMSGHLTKSTASKEILDILEEFL
jgi:signal transduction histidine kinase/ActR/RegA family two-component response regulator